MKIPVTTILWTIAVVAMLLGTSCGDADDSLAAETAANLMNDARTGPASVDQRRGKRPRLPGRTETPLRPSTTGASCGDAAPTAVLRTGAEAEVDVAAVGWRYYMDQTPVLHVAAYVRNVCGPHVGRFDFYTPDGTLSRRQQVSFVADPNGLNVRKVAGGYVVETELRIAGTEIDGQAMTGVWSVNFSLDGGPRALGLGIFELYR